MLRTNIRRSAVVAIVALFGMSAARARAQDVRVTVVTILASDKSDFIDPKLKDLAHEVKSREPNLTGYRLGKTAHRDISFNQKQAIKLFDDKDFSTDVTLIGKDDTSKRVEIEIKPPMIGAIRYEVAYEKFFPIVTRAVVDGERLIIAYMVKPADKRSKTPTDP
jgi:hypothetical protein